MLQDLTFSLNMMRGEYTQELDGAWGGDQLFEVLKFEGFHLVVTEVVPVSGSAGEKLNLFP